jgi:hypothetical protein
MKTLQFLIILLWILFSKSYDIYCTYLHTPDLSKEANPWVSVLGMNWFWLLMVIGLLTIYTCYTLYLISFKPIKLYPLEKGYSFSNFIPYMYFGKKSSWLAIIYRVPPIRNKRFHYTFGNILVRYLVFAGIVSTVMWLLINNSEAYRVIHNHLVIYAILISGTFIILYNYYKTNYNKYQTQ